MQERDDILEFWFGASTHDPAAAGSNMRRWFAGGEEMDRAIRERFGALVDRALAGELDEDWSKDIRSRLALVLLLDQFPRNIYRDTPRAYAGDERAQRLVHEALDGSLDSGLRPEERLFLVMPLVHAEDMRSQERVVVEMERLRDGSPPPAIRPLVEGGIEQSRKYRDIIARFGRFPHRNAVLGRASTPEEIEFLRDWKEKMAPSAARDAANRS